MSLYIDNILTDEERAAVDAHLAQCPLCRQKLDDFAALRQSLRRISQVPAMPKDLLASVKTAVRTELAPAAPQKKSYFSKSFREFLQMRVMPLTVGTAASLFFGFSLLWILLSSAHRQTPNDTYIATTQVPVIVPGIPQNEGEITAADIVAQRGLVSSESPSINPQGALLAMTQSLVSRNIKEDEVVVVADVSKDGLAEIEEVVEPLDDQNTVYELEKAMQQNSSDAPFVPAFLDRRADSVRVVLKIQRVDVKTSLPRVKRK
ncbi:MAG TPA: anti-sigma factor [Pyrinomonadaceae bacterium]